MFFINDKAGIAYESTEGGIAKWRSADKDFTRLMSSEERAAFMSPCRRVSADEAADFMLAKDAASGAAAPRA
ncbi:MAG: hypothetical protein BWX70_03395 [Verrucomicrobia bacterium ADurb.Bin070]|nr:MAG: hypothetical protein BWX70_03395 [Verrucomicrobia bacterium ADurb.Bin070]